MGVIADRLAELDLTLPAVPAPVGSYVPAVLHGGLVRTTGQLAFRDGALMATGRVGVEVSLEDGVAAARQAALNGIAAVADLLGGVDEIGAVLEVIGYIACSDDFTGHAPVLNGASDLIEEIFGVAGQHIRYNVGVACLPLGSPVEIGLVASVAVAAPGA
jgi:enamine deaminase RidA (YjgF/YER057c/UK114 family)